MENPSILTAPETPAGELLATLRRQLAGQSADDRDLLRLGEQLLRCGHPEAALAAFEVAVESEPAYAEAWRAVAAARLGLGRPHAALAAANEALRLGADDPDALFDVAVVLAALDDFPAAVHCYFKLLAEHGNHRGALLNLPIMLMRAGRTADARNSQERALEAFPLDPDFHFNLGEILTSLEDHAAAADAYERAHQLDPGYAKAAVAAAYALAAAGEVAESNRRLAELRRTAPEAMAAFRSPLAADKMAAFPEMDPGRMAIIAAHGRQKRCDWNRRDADIGLFAELIKGGCGNKPVDNPDLPFLAFGLPLPAADRRRLAIQVAGRIAASVGKPGLVRSARGERRRLRVGYVSGDFRPHPVSYLFNRMFALHDRERFEIMAYATGPGAGSPERRQVEAAADRFCDAARFDAATLAQRIAYDGVDILVDLGGYTLHSGSAAFALRPAPVQLGYMAYMATSGAPWMDYAILDRQVMTPEERSGWTESIAYLPDTLFLCDDALVPEEGETRAGHGLPADAFVYCSFNAGWKIDPATFDLWMAVLRTVERGVLWVLDDAPGLQENLRREARLRGVSPERLVFAPRLPRNRHLARYRLADAFLDALPCSAQTTAIEALSAGVPLITLPGSTVQSRAASGLLAAHGLAELVAGSEGEFVALAVRLAQDKEWAGEIRQKVQRREDSRLFCTERRVREIERAYEMMWERHLAGLPPADFDVPPLSEMSAGRASAA